MKKFTRMMALVLLGGSTLVTSCVSEDISPEVENLRQAQVNYLNSKAAMEQAKADNQAAMTAKIQAETALIQAEVELKQAIMQAETDAKIAEMEADVASAEANAAEAQARAAQAEAALQQALDNLAAQVNETAQEYLAMYQSTMAQANNKLEDIISLEGDLLRFEAYVDGSGNVVNFDAAAAALAAQIAEDEATVDALEATITRLEGLNTDAASVEAELVEIMSELDALSADLATAELDRDRYYEETFEDIDDAYYSASYITNNISFLEEQIALKEAEIEEVQESITSLESQIAPFQAELDAAEANFTPAVEQAEDLLEVWIQAYAVFRAAAINNAPGDEEYDTAEAANVAAQADFEAYAGDYGTDNPQVIRDNNWLIPGADPSSEFGEIITQYTNVLNDPTFQDLEYKLAQAYYELDILMNGTDYWPYWEIGLNELNEMLADLQSSLSSIYDEMGVADFTELETAYMEALTMWEAKLEVVTKLEAEVWALNDLKWTLEGYLNGNPAEIEDRIESIQFEISSLQANIEDAKSALVNNEISAEEWAATIVRTEEKIDRLTTEYNALVALANDFLEQFNEVVEN